MEYKDFQDKVNMAEKSGEWVGVVIGKIAKEPFRFLALMCSLGFASLVAFIYAIKRGAEKA